MKKFVVLCMTALLMSGMALAQDANLSKPKFDSKACAERMTERMAKEYNLNDSQKAKLLEANQAWIETMAENRPAAPARRWEGPRHRRGNYHRHCCGHHYDCCDEPYYDRRDRRAEDREPLTDEQREQLRAERAKKVEAAKEARQKYRKQLQDIMTDEQFSDYLDRNYRWGN